MIPYWASERNIEHQAALNRVPVFVSPSARAALYDLLLSTPELEGIGYGEFISLAIDSKFWAKGVTVEMIERDIERTTS